tara:strand:- start:28 stop:258 length:231 start_codon:yes stop_codon:yes gene_type:complete
MIRLTQPQEKLLKKILESKTGFYFQYDSEKNNPKSSLKMFNTFLHNREQNVAYKLKEMGFLRVEDIDNKWVFFPSK